MTEARMLAAISQGQPMPSVHPRQMIRQLVVRHWLGWQPVASGGALLHAGDDTYCALPGRDDHEDYDVLLRWLREKGLEPW